MNTAAPEPICSTALSRLMRADAVLPDDIVPGGARDTSGLAALVTGATGFLGRYLVRELLCRPRGDIVCLVRAESTLEARQRLSHSLRLAGIDPDAHAGRLIVVAAAVDQPQFGLSDEDYRSLADRVGRVFHCAANVNWARGYRQLRASNVLGTLEIIRFACTGHRKHTLYSSTIAVCFANDVPHEIDERTDMLEYIEGMPLPYAQTKCVSESLLRSAAMRGLPVSVVRPALISGDSRTGVANPHDLISALIQGCVVSGSAIDTDWNLDCVPVDHVARTLSRLGDSSRSRWELLNLFNERGRHWREVVLWMNLYGYPIELVAHAEWLRRTFDRLGTRYSLFGYRRFFGAASSRNSGRAPYQSFLRYRQGQVRNTATRAILDELGCRTPGFDATLLERYMQHYASTGLLPEPTRIRNRAQRRIENGDHLRHTMGRWLETNDLVMSHVLEKPIASHNGIFNEVASARVGSTMGIRRFGARVAGRASGDVQTLDILVKDKPADTVMQDLLAEVAALCDPRLGGLCEAFKTDLGLAGGHERELAIYERTEPCLRRFMPRVFGTGRDPGRGIWSVAMEFLPQAETMNLGRAQWQRDEVNGVLSGLAILHSGFYRRDRALHELPWLKAPPPVRRMQEMAPLWKSLARYSAEHFETFADEAIRPVQQSFIASLGDWWPEMQSHPVTLVHNDCNPRNLVIRRFADSIEPVFFDWELATIDIPQRDAAELLCFMLPEASKPEDLAAYLEVHRRGLEVASGIPVDEDEWLRGFILALRHLLINRLPLYTLMHRFRPQPFLPTVIRNWQALYRLADALSLQRSGNASQVTTLRRARP